MRNKPSAIFHFDNNQWISKIKSIDRTYKPSLVSTLQSVNLTSLDPALVNIHPASIHSAFKSSFSISTLLKENASTQVTEADLLLSQVIIEYVQKIPVRYRTELPARFEQNLQRFVETQLQNLGYQKYQRSLFMTIFTVRSLYVKAHEEGRSFKFKENEYQSFIKGFGFSGQEIGAYIRGSQDGAITDAKQNSYPALKWLVQSYPLPNDGK